MSEQQNVEKVGREYDPFYYRPVIVAVSGFGQEHLVNRRTDYCVTCDLFGGVHR